MKANEVIVVDKVGHSIQTNSLMNASVLFFRSFCAKVKGRAQDPSSARVVDDLTATNGTVI